MSIFNKKKSSFEILELNDWYENIFSTEEKEIISKKVPFFFDGTHEISNQSISNFLSNFLSYFNTKEYMQICKKIVDKILEYTTSESSYEKHFIYMGIMKFYYKNGFINEAENICKEAVDFAPEVLKSIKNDPFNNGCIPSNPFYEQLAIIYKKKKEWNNVIYLCNKAKKEGWIGDYDKRIEEAQKKIKS